MMRLFLHSYIGAGELSTVLAVGNDSYTVQLISQPMPASVFQKQLVGRMLTAALCL